VIARPVFITTVYPTVILDKTIVEVMPITEHAYNFWGKEHVSEQDIKTYFPARLAYPYQFSKTGSGSLRNRLKENSLVDPTIEFTKKIFRGTAKWLIPSEDALT
jgi:hypothetical protein